MYINEAIKSEMSNLLLIVLIWAAYCLLKRAHFVSRFNYLPGTRRVTFGVIGDLPALCSTVKRCGSTSAGVTEFIAGVTMFSPEDEEKSGLRVVWLGPLPIVLIYSPSLIEQILGSQELIRKGRAYAALRHWLGTGLLTSRGKKWFSHRKFLTPAFHFRILESFIPIMDGNAKILVRILKEKSNNNEGILKDLRKPILRCTLDVICETAMGKKLNAQQNQNVEYVEAVNQLTEIIVDRIFSPWTANAFFFSLTPRGRSHDKYLDIVRSFTVKVIEERLQEFRSQAKSCDEYDGEESDKGMKRKQPFMDLLIRRHLEKPEELTFENIREEVDTFMFEGHDTTAWGIIWAILLLGCHPEAQKKVQDEVDTFLACKTDECGEEQITLDDLRSLTYLEAVVKESQRLYPSVPLVARRCEVDTKLGKYLCPAGCELVIPVFRVHRDKAHWSDPEKFIPERFIGERKQSHTPHHPYAYLPFSAGPRNCIGQRFAKFEEKIILARIFQHFTVTSLDDRCSIISSLALVNKSTQAIRVKLTPRA